MRSGKVHKRRRLPQEIATARTAIRNHCLECCGYESAEVGRCTAPACWLYPYWFGSGVSPEVVLSASIDGASGGISGQEGTPEGGNGQKAKGVNYEQ